MAHWRPRHPHLCSGHAGLGPQCRRHGVRRPHCCSSVHRYQDGRAGHRVGALLGRKNIFGHHVLQLAAVRYRPESGQLETALPDSQRSRRQRGQFQPATLHRDPLVRGQGRHHQYTGRVGLLESQGTGIPAAGHVLQHVRLALRYPGAQQLRPIHRKGQRRPLGRGVLRDPPAPHQGTIRHLVDPHGGQAERRAAGPDGQSLGGDNGPVNGS